MASLSSLFVFGLNPGIDFTGGSILEAEYQKARPSMPAIREQLSPLNINSLYIQPIGEKGVLLRMKEIDEALHQQILEKLKQAKTAPKPVAEFIEQQKGEEEAGQILGNQDQSQVKEVRFESIGPVIGRELKQKTTWMIILASVLIILYIAWAFRRVSRPCRSWQYGIAGILALGHDVLIPVGVFSVLGRFWGVQITIPIITALLTVMGYSINDTVVVFDRIRENLIKTGAFDFRQTVDSALNQTLTRSVNTSLTTLFVLLALFFFGGVTLKYFALALVLGIVAGTYSSIFLAAPLLVSWLNLKRRK